MKIHISDQMYSLSPHGAGASLFDLVSSIPGVSLHTPCGGHGKCGKCVCAVRFSGNVPSPTPAESAFLADVDRDATLARCHAPLDAHLRYLCLCPADNITDVYLPDSAELTGAVFTDTVSAQTPVLTTKTITLIPPTLEQPTDTLSNLRNILGTTADIPYPLVCRVSGELQNGHTAFTAYLCNHTVLDIVPSPRTTAVLSVDIGTTTVALSLRDPVNGRELAGDVFGNPQRTYGGDVISRMSRAIAGERPALTSVLRTVLAERTKSLCDRVGLQTDDILYTAVAGNSVMEHLFAGLDPAPIAVSPFFMQTSFGTAFRANDPLFEETLPFLNPHGLVWLAPLAASYVGGDITVGLAYLLQKYPEMRTKNTLFLDLGTNGEICVCANGTYYFAATAAGPALEGAEIAMGMSATSGAVCKVRVDEENGCFVSEIVGDTTPIGICGSGIIDAVACAVRTGLIAPTGSFCDDFDELEDYADLFDDVPPRDYDPELYEKLRETHADEDENCLYITETVKLTSPDIRAVQTAKAAISAGIDVLLRTAGLTDDDLDAVYLAGSFGGGINVRSAAEIGLFPAVCVKKGIVTAVGNTSLAGATAYLFDKDVRDNLTGIMKNARYTELSSDKTFTDAFVNGMMF